MNLNDELIKLAQIYNVEKIEDYFSECIKVKVDINQISQTFSKIGGEPDLPKDVDWPTEYRVITKKRLFRKREVKKLKMPLSFLAQFSLAEISKEINDGFSTNSGFLYFFYCQDQDSWGIYEDDRLKFRILYSDCKLEDCVRASYPGNLVKHGIYNEIKVCFERSMTLKSVEEDEDMPQFISDEFYEDLNELSNFNEDGYTQLLGSSYNIQGEMKSHALKMINKFSNNDKFKIEDIVLLFQLDSIDECNMNWGDGGMLYFWTTKKSIANNDYRNSWMILQCY